MQVKSEAFIARVIADGRVTIPENVRIFLGVSEGDLVKVTVEKTEAEAKVHANQRGKADA